MGSSASKQKKQAETFGIDPADFAAAQEAGTAAEKTAEDPLGAFREVVVGGGGLLVAKDRIEILSNEMKNEILHPFRNCLTCFEFF